MLLQNLAAIQRQVEWFIFWVATHFSEKKFQDISRIFHVISINISGHKLSLCPKITTSIKQKQTNYATPQSQNPSIPSQHATYLFHRAGCQIWCKSTKQIRKTTIHVSYPDENLTRLAITIAYNFCLTEVLKFVWTVTV